MAENVILAFLIFFPFLAALIVYGIGRISKPLRDTAVIASGVIQFLVMGAVCVLLVQGTLHAPQLELPKLCGMGLHFELDGFRVIYGMVAAVMWMVTLMFSGEYFAHHRNRNRYYLFQLFTLGALLGVFFASDLFTTFVFFEIMSFTSYVWVAQEETREALRAAETYLAVAVIGGLVMLFGLFYLYDMLGTLQIAALKGAASACADKGRLYLAGGCIFFGFAAKAGAVPLHIWLPKAHPVAPAPSSALLSGILTKSGIFGILAVSCNLFYHDVQWGVFVLVTGLVTMFLGALLAIFSVDLKRTLACSSMSQIGFILVGVGMIGILGEENGLAIRGTLLHMVNHSLFKLVLFLVAGAVYMNLHKLDLNQTRGFGRNKPLLHAIYLMGALGIGGVPLFSGYISKTLLHESILEGIAHMQKLGNSQIVMLLQASEWIFLISGGMTLAYMTKLYIAVFWEKNTDAALQLSYEKHTHYWTKLSAVPVALCAAAIPLMGILPQIFMDKPADFGSAFFLPEGQFGSVAYFSLENLKGAAISVFIGAALYAVIRCLLMKQTKEGRIYVNRWAEWLDLENLVYRPLLLKVLPFLCAILCRLLDSLVDAVILLLRKTVYRDRKLPHELAEGSGFTHLLGSILDWGHAVRCRWTDTPLPEYTKTYEHRLAMLREKFSETNTVIARSLSFGLLLFYVGLVATLLYLLFG